MIQLSNFLISGYNFTLQKRILFLQVNNPLLFIPELFFQDKQSFFELLFRLIFQFLAKKILLSGESIDDPIFFFDDFVEMLLFCL
jgi:hypothetical protein